MDRGSEILLSDRVLVQGKMGSWLKRGTASVDILWFIPGHGDSRYLGTSISRRSTSYTYLSQVVQAIDSLGYSGALLPTGQTCEDAFILAASLFPATRQMKFMVAVRPGTVSPV